MRLSPVCAACLALALVTAPLTAQDGAGRPRTGRGGESGPGGARGAGVEAMRDRRGARRDRAGERQVGDRSQGEERSELRDRRRERESALAPDDRTLLADRVRQRGGDGARGARTPEQQAFVQALRDKRRELRAAVAAGTLVRHEAAEQLRAWLRSNPPVGAPSP